ncbi:endopeptidase La [Candidatus Poribacteria bacterium]|nr:MAG: endopeptidase La [Candidatus Poribacteria bacterium]
MNQEAEKRTSDSALLLPVIAFPPDFETFFPKTKAVVDQRLTDWTPLTIARKMGVLAARAALNTNLKVLLLHQKNELEEDTEPQPNDLHTIGIVANIVQDYDPKDGTLRIAIETSDRAVVAHCTQVEGYLQATVKIVSELTGVADAATAFIKEAKSAFRRYAKEHPKLILPDVERYVRDLVEPGILADNIARFADFPSYRHQEILEELNPIKRLNFVTELLDADLDLVDLEEEIQNEVQESVRKTHREFYLQERMKAIQRELGRADEIDEIDDLREQVKNAGMTEEAEKKALKELDRLAQIPPMSAESGVIRNYVDWLLAVPWKERTENNIELDQAENILNEDHYGLDKPKQNVLEYLAVLKLVEQVKGPILCLVGPPGVGKTSLGKSIARATGRKFVRMSLGGVRDEAEIRGHRRTYIGAIPGRIIQGLRDVKVKNPLFLLDEIDKLSSDWRGDPASALLEVLDPEQNETFRDHYLDVEFDLSDVMFVTTANTRITIPPALEDRMEVIELPGYTDFEKHKIATFHPNGLIPKQLKSHGLKEENITFADSAIFDIVHKYTREAGVRNLERNVTGICRKIAKQIVTDDTPDLKVKVTALNLSDYLGPPKFTRTKAQEHDEVGVSTGMVWTQVGGDIVSVEATLMPGEGKLDMTGQLQEVMRESVQTAVAYLRSRAKHFDIPKDTFEKHDIHIHIPEGAVPKDGPSAGITVATAILSAITEQKVRKDVAMTGEITLRGHVLPIGGLKEKSLAAYRNGIVDIIMPEENEKDLADVPNEIREKIRWHQVNDITQVLELALKKEVEDDSESEHDGIAPAADDPTLQNPDAIGQTGN